MQTSEQQKAQFFALYWGQNVIHNDDYIWRQNENFDTVLSIYNGDLSKWYAVLTPLHMITEKQMLTIAQKALFDPRINDWIDSDVFIGEGDFDNVGNCSIELGCRCWKGLLTINYETGSILMEDEDGIGVPVFSICSVIDTIRKMGIAFNYDGISVDQQISKGWIKLKTA